MKIRYLDALRAPEASRLALQTAPAICCLVTAIAFLLAYRSDGGFFFPNDDAYIALHNAQVLWAGHDSAYVGVPALFGETSGAHLALLMLFESVIRPDTAALFVLGGVIAAAYVLGLLYACIAVGCSRIEATVLALAGLVLGGSIFQLLNGLDTGLAMAAVAWDIALLADRRHPRLLALLCGVMPFVRPELAFMSLASLAIMLAARQPHSGRFKTLALAAIAAAPFLLWYWIDTGSPIPSTIGAKTYFFADRYVDWHRKAAWLIHDLTRALGTVFPLFLCAAFIRPRVLRAALFLFAAAFVAAYFVRFPSGITTNADRYLFLFVPVILFGIACGVSATKRRRRLLTLASLAISILFVPLGVRFQHDEYAGGIVGYRHSLDDAVAWMNANLPAGSMVMVHDAGYVAYAGHFRLVDLVGLKTPAAMEIHKELTYPSAGKLRPQAIVRIAAKFHPRYLLAIHGWQQNFDFTGALAKAGWRAAEIYSSHAPAGTFAGDIYDVYALSPP
ncbi:MAG TPA: hypothetical protein VFX06_10730 [Stellaceae bacterium]|nr:hypothetical protein [Stellaceae bacterium]